jgi:hypothetical protein
MRRVASCLVWRPWRSGRERVPEASSNGCASARYANSGPLGSRRCVTGQVTSHVETIVRQGPAAAADRFIGRLSLRATGTLGLISKRRDVAADDAGQCFGLGRSFEKAAASQRLPELHPEREDVASAIDRPATRLLPRHVAQLSLNDTTGSHGRAQRRMGPDQPA